MKTTKKQARRARVAASTTSPVRDFTDVEEAFFRAGETIAEPSAAESFDDLDEGYRRPSLLRRLFSRAA